MGAAEPEQPDGNAAPSADADTDHAEPEQPAGDAASRPSADADADSAYLPSGPGARTTRKRKRKSGGAQRAKKAAVAADEEEGGYTDKGRMLERTEGGVVVTGTKRSCVPDALFSLLATLSLLPNTDEARDDVRGIMPDDEDQNTRFTRADEYVRERFGKTLTRATGHFMVKGGPASALLNTPGVHAVVQLRITCGPDDKKPDLHCVAYDGHTLKDNYKYSKIKVLDEGDRTVQGARDVFNSLVKGCSVEIKNIYLLDNVCPSA